MSFIIDTNVLLRTRDRDDPRYYDCIAAIELLQKRGERLYVCTQVLVEYWVVLTRPCDVNGCGLSFEEASNALDKIRGTFCCLTEPGDMADRWQQTIAANKVMGKPAHDARIVALMLAHGVTSILTLNVNDFARYGITSTTPESVLRRTT